MVVSFYESVLKVKVMFYVGIVCYKKICRIVLKKYL